MYLGSLRLMADDKSRGGFRQSSGERVFPERISQILFHQALLEFWNLNQIVQEPHARLSTSHHVELTVHNGRHLVSLGSKRDNP
jgi:hypothetical protein